MPLQSAIRDYALHNSQDALAQLVPELKNNGGKDLYTALLIMKMFEHTHPELQAQLGSCYYCGDGVKTEIEKAFNLLREAEANGSIQCKYDLGWYFYDRGEYSYAIDMFKFCLSHQDAFDDQQLNASYICLGDSYSRLSDPNLSAAIENLLVAADKYHDGFACGRLGTIYSDESFRTYDANKAIKYYELGASYGDEASAYRLAVNYIFGNEKLQIKRNGKKAERILLPFSDSDNCDILRSLGNLYRQGDPKNGVNRDYDKSKIYYKRSWEIQNDPHVAANLGYIYFYLNEYEDAAKMLIIADEENYSIYSDFLGRMYKDGVLGTRDIQKATYYYGRAYEAEALNNVFTYVEFAELLEQNGDYQKAYDVSNQGLEKFKDVSFLYIKANLVLSGKITNRNSPEEAAEMMEDYINYDGIHKANAHLILGEYYFAVREYRKAERHYMDAFSLGISDAAVYLGRLYENGGGTISADVKKAFEWYLKAAEAGSSIGKEEVGCFKKSVFFGYHRTRNL